jgi:hypothetical protein
MRPPHPTTRALAARQAAQRRRHVARLVARRDARLLRAAFVALATHATCQQAARASAEALAHRRAVATTRAALCMWVRAAVAAAAARDMAARDARRRLAAAFDAWHAAAARGAAARAAEGRVAELAAVAGQRCARRTLWAWRLAAEGARRERSEAAAAKAAGRVAAAEAREVALVQAVAAAEARTAAAVRSKAVLEQVRKKGQGGVLENHSQGGTGGAGLAAAPACTADFRTRVHSSCAYVLRRCAPRVALALQDMLRLQQRENAAAAAQASALAAAARDAEARATDAERKALRERAAADDLRVRLAAAEAAAAQATARAAALEGPAAAAAAADTRVEGLQRQLAAASRELEAKRREAACAGGARAAAAAGARAAEAAAGALRRAELEAARDALARERREAALRAQLRAARGVALREGVHAALLESHAGAVAPAGAPRLGACTDPGGNAAADGSEAGASAHWPQPQPSCSPLRLGGSKRAGACAAGAPGGAGGCDCADWGGGSGTKRNGTQHSGIQRSGSSSSDFRITTEVSASSSGPAFEEPDADSAAGGHRLRSRLRPARAGCVDSKCTVAAAPPRSSVAELVDAARELLASLAVAPPGDSADCCGE